MTVIHSGSDQEKYLTTSLSGKLVIDKAPAVYVFVCVCACTQSRPTLCNPTDCSQPGSSVHGIFQARILERVAISFSRGFSQSRNQTRLSLMSPALAALERALQRVLL